MECRTNPLTKIGVDVVQASLIGFLSHEFKLDYNRCLATTVLFTFTLTFEAWSQEGPKDAVVLIIRHAENPENGRGLSPRGQQRAQAYKDYFQNLTVDSMPLVPDTVFAADDSKHSHRPRLTVEPFAKAAKLQIDARFQTEQFADLAAELRAMHQGKRTLICWRHGHIPKLLRALGAKPEEVLPNGKWPGSVYDWVIVLRYDGNGHLIPGTTKRMNEHLLPGDSQ